MKLDGRRTKTREKIIKLTVQEIEKNGYANVSIRDIFAKLDLSPSAFYNHFSSKYALFDEVLFQISKRIFDEYSEHERQEFHGETSIDAIVFLTNYIMRQFTDHRDLMDFLFFSPNALAAFAKLHSFEDPKHPILSEAYHLLKSFKEEYQLAIDIDVLLIKCWSFFQGYILLTSSNIIEYKDKLIYEVLNDIIQGDSGARANLTVTSE